MLYFESVEINYIGVHYPEKNNAPMADDDLYFSNNFCARKWVICYI